MDKINKYISLITNIGYIFPCIGNATSNPIITLIVETDEKRADGLTAISMTGFNVYFRFFHRYRMGFLGYRQHILYTIKKMYE